MKIKKYLETTKELLDQIREDQITHIIDAITKVTMSGKKVVVAGNGGSASLASHFATDLSKRSVDDNKIHAVSLVDNISLITMISNDFSYDEIFSYQLDRILEKGDLFVAISASGNSTNIVKACESAIARGAIVVGLCGFQGGDLKEHSSHHIHIKIDDYGMVESLVGVIGHIIAGQFELYSK